MSEISNEEPPSAEESGPVEAVRLFIALPLPEGLLQRVTRLSQNLQTGFGFTPCHPKWVSPETIHLTLRFLGATSTERINALIAATGEIARRHGPILIEAAGLGVFPHWRNPSVLWAGVRGRVKAMRALARDFEAMACEHGYEPSRTRFSPHLTLARFRSRKGIEAAHKVVRSHESFQSGEFECAEVVLFRSELQASGAHHHRVASYTLGDPGPGSIKTPPRPVDLPGRRN